MRASFALCVKSVEHGEWKLAEDLNEIDPLQELFQPRYFTRIESQESQFFRSLQLGLIYQVFRNTEARTRGFPIGRESQPLEFDIYWRIYATHRRIHVRGCVKKTLITGGRRVPVPPRGARRRYPRCRLRRCEFVACVTGKPLLPATFSRHPLLSRAYIAAPGQWAK